MLKIGNKAPDFTLLDGDENSVSLSDFKGQRVVLWFFPRASTPGWTNEGLGFRDEFKKFKDKNIASTTSLMYKKSLIWSPIVILKFLPERAALHKRGQKQTHIHN